MAENRSKARLPEPGRWKRRFLLTCVVCAVLLLVLYFVATSSGFVKSVIIPRAGAALNADISVSSAQVSPFTKVILHNVNFTPKGAETLFTAEELTARYSLLSIIRGRIVVDEVTVVSPVISVVENADGTRNLDPLLKPQKKEPGQQQLAAERSQPLEVDIKSVTVKNATVRYLKRHKDGQDLVELASINLNLGNLKNAATGKLDLSAALAVDRKAPEAAASATIQALLTAGFAFDLTRDLKPGAVKGNASFSIGQATGALADLNALAAKLDCNSTLTEVRQLALRFSRGTAPLGAVHVSGPFDAQKLEGRLKAEILSIDRQVLNLAGAASGMDFGTTTINSTNDLELAKGGQLISVVGKLNVDRFQARKENQTTPTLDLRCDYNVTVDQAAKSALIKVLNLAGTQGGKPLLQTELTSPMTIKWGGASDSVGDAALNLTIANLNLADWQAFAADLAPQGMANAKAKLLSQKGGNQLGFDLDARVDNFSARVGSNELNRADIRAVAKGSAVDLKQFKLEGGRLELAQQGQAALTASASGTFDSATQDADVQFAANAVLTRLLALMPQPDVSVTAGSLDFKGKATSKDKNQTVTGQLGLTDFTGQVAGNKFASFGLGVDLDVSRKGEQVEIRKAAGQVQEGQKPGGKFEATGNYDLGRKAGQFAVKLADFNENGLRPFLESALGDNKLVSVSVNTTASASLEANGDAKVKADAQITNLLVKDPAGSLPSTPLEARVQVDAGVAKNVAEIRQCQLTLTPTERAKNELGLSGMVDFSKSNAITGNLKLAAESLDVTRYYDLFAGPAKPTDTKPEAAPTSPAPSPSTPVQKEPDPVKLPVNNFTFDANIGRFYLREVEITNLQTTAKLDASKVLLNPCQLVLNGAPVSATADLDLGVPGYKYDISFGADGIPVEPLANTFSPTYRGQAKGTLIAKAQMKGAGVTGRSLKSSLNATASFSFTNANIRIVGPKVKAVLIPISVALRAPELLQSPLDYLNASLRAGSGKIEVTGFTAHSAMFRAESQGVIPISDVLNNSPLNQPIEVYLPRELLAKLRFSNVPTNNAYAKLPHFVQLQGTLGKPDPKTDKLVIAGLTAGGLGGAIGGKAGGILQGVSGLLGGNLQPTPSQTNSTPATTNAPATNVQPQDPVKDILNLLKKPKK
jgi:uncharacterized protein involved in outer membrane biogenesis